LKGLRPSFPLTDSWQAAEKLMFLYQGTTLVGP